MAAGQETSRSTPATSCSAKGEPADFLWILLDGQIATVRGSVNETARARHDDARPVSGPAGCAAWGDASSSAGYRGHRRRASADGRTFTVAVRRPRTTRRRVVPVRQAHHHRRLPDGPRHRGRRHANASRWSPSARSPPGWPTRSTTRRRRRCAPSKALRTTCDADAVVARQPRASRSITAEQYVGARRACAASCRSDRSSSDGAMATDGPRGGSRQLAGRPWRRRRMAARSACSRLSAPISDWFDECEAVVGPDALGPALQWISTHDQRVAVARGADRHDQPHLAPRRGRASRTRRWIGPRCSASTSTTASRARW